MIAALGCLDLTAAAWLAERDPALVHLPEAVAATQPDWSLHDVQWTPGRGCRLAYSMAAETTGAATFVAFNLKAKSWFSHDFRSDPGLPGLLAASDPTLVSRRLQTVVEEPILHCRVQPVRYRAGTRCVLRYDVQTASGTTRCYAKVFPRSVFTDTSERTKRVASAAKPAGVPVARVLATWPDWCTTVSVALPGRSASAVLRDTAVAVPRRVDLARSLGGLLAEFHALSGVTVPHRTASDQLRALTDLLPAVDIVDPTVAGRLRGLLDRLGRQVRFGDHHDALIHGAFRPGQVVVDETGLLHLLDLDGVGRGDAAQDLGTATSHLAWQAVRQPGQADELHTVQDALLAGYRASGATVHPASLAWWRAAALTQIAGRRFRRLEMGDWALTSQLLDQAEGLLDDGRTGERS